MCQKPLMNYQLSVGEKQVGAAKGSANSEVRLACCVLWESGALKLSWNSITSLLSDALTQDYHQHLLYL